MANNQRPRFEPSHDHLDVSPLSDEWSALISCAADFSEDIFEVGTTQLVHHPEYNSTLILRSEVISDVSFSGDPAELPAIVPTFLGLRPVRCIHRKLLPRRPGRDAPLEQYCTFYASSEADALSPNTLVLTPIVNDGNPLPYYHPAVFHIAFRFLSITSGSNHSSHPDISQSHVLRIDVLRLADVSLDPNDRLYRTSLALLETLHRYCWGSITHYKKRVVHDALVPRDKYQDLYLVMRERHKGLVDTWKEVTDPLKHVFEDIGIATYLILLWKDTFAQSPDGSVNADDDLASEPWKKWPRPPGGFLDLGCGNGLLTHILSAEGYAGTGVDLRARTSWEGYCAEAKAALRVAAVNPTRMFDDSPPEEGDDSLKIAPGCFIIANHADELTPWAPVLATLSGAAGYLSIPCCAWTFDARFQRGKGPAFPTSAIENDAGEGLDEIDTTKITTKQERAAQKQKEKEGEDAFIETLNLGGDGNSKSGYSQYRIWLARLSAHCGWMIECETLRIPSTRAWAVIGRRREAGDSGVENSRAIVEDVKHRALFKTRKPEGKAGEH